MDTLAQSSVNSFTFDWPAGVSIGLLVLYLVQVFVRFWLHPLSTLFGVSLISRRRWAIRLLEKESRAILGVQTFRNSCYFMSLLASACITLGGLLIKKSLNEAPGSQTRVVMMSLAFIAFAAFYTLLKVLEALSDSGYLTLLSNSDIGPDPVKKEVVEVKIKRNQSNLQINQSEEKQPEIEMLDMNDEERKMFDRYALDLEGQLKFHVKKVKTFLKNMDVVTIYGFLSFRLLTYTIPIAFWIISSYWLLGATLVVISFLVNLDRVERIAVFSNLDDE